MAGGMSGVNLSILTAGIIGYAVLMLICLVAVVIIRWRRRHGLTYAGHVPPRPLPKPLSIADSTLYQCRACGCEWRKWDDGFWSLASGEQRPCEKCERGNMDGVTK